MLYNESDEHHEGDKDLRRIMEGSILSDAMFEIRWPGFYVQPLKVRSKTNKVRKNILQEVPVEKDANVKQDIPEAQAEDSKDAADSRHGSS